MKEIEKVTRFLLILDESYMPFRSQILYMDPMSTLGQIYQLAVQEESQHLFSSEYAKVRERVVLSAHSNPSPKGTVNKGHGEIRGAMLGFLEDDAHIIKRE